jgi:hypothetical protein
MSASEILTALRKRYSGYPIVREVVLADPYEEAMKPTRRIDGLLYESGRLTAIEIKVTRADFRNDTAEKRRAWMEHTHRFVYATPAGLVSPDEVPEGCGLWEVDEATGFVKSRKRAVIRKDPTPLPVHVLGAMLYRVSKYEKASAENETLRNVVNEARHEEDCMLGFHYADGLVGVCTCWKASAVGINNEEGN